MNCSEEVPNLLTLHAQFVSDLFKDFQESKIRIRIRYSMKYVNPQHCATVVCAHLYLCMFIYMYVYVYMCMSVCTCMCRSVQKTSGFDILHPHRNFESHRFPSLPLLSHNAI